jgi:hypothetical protein
LLRKEFVLEVEPKKPFGKMSINEYKIFGLLDMESIYDMVHSNSTTLLHAGVEFPAVDMVIYVPNGELLFIRSRTAADPACDDLAELTESKYYFVRDSEDHPIRLATGDPAALNVLHESPVSIGSAILDMIYGKYGHKCVLDKTTSTLKFSNPKGVAMDKVHYIFAGFQIPEKQTEKKAKNVLRITNLAMEKMGILYK